MAREIPNVIGVKEASGNPEQILTILRDRPKGFLVLSGDDAWTLPLMAVGAEGIIPSRATKRRGHGQMVDTRDAAIHERLLPAPRQLHRGEPGPAKAALVMMGCSRFRAPAAGPAHRRE
jgi:4-hydroxy-tetrahydrodipicolinate synthase